MEGSDSILLCYMLIGQVLWIMGGGFVGWWLADKFLNETGAVGLVMGVLAAIALMIGGSFAWIMVFGWY